MIGYCSLGSIIVQLEKESELSELQLAGYNGNPSLWNPSNGLGSKILTSKDKYTWLEVGCIPFNSNFAKSITDIKLKSSICKFIKIQNRDYIGLSFFNAVSGKSGNIYNLYEGSSNHNSANLSSSNINSQQVKTGTVYVKNFTSSGSYIFKNQVVGTTNLAELNDPLLSKGINILIY